MHSKQNAQQAAAGPDRTARSGYSEGQIRASRTTCRSTALATPNYSYEKRQRELAKKRKVEEKRQRKVNKPDGEGEPGEGGEPSEAAHDAETPVPRGTPPAAN